MRYAWLFFVVLFSGCHTLKIRNSYDNEMAISEAKIGKTYTKNYGFAKTDRTSLNLECSEGRWAYVRLGESSGDVGTVAFSNAIVGTGSALVLGTGIMACVFPSPVAYAFCGVGIAGMAYGVATVLSVPFTHVSPLMLETPASVEWACLK
jgi:hypothetical protein